MRVAPLALLACLIAVPACDGCAVDDTGRGGPAGDGAGGDDDDDGLPTEGEGEGDEGEGEGDVDGRVLVIEPADPTLLATVGGQETLQLAAFVVDDAGRAPASPVQWQSLDALVGSVDQSGLFTPSRERAGDCRVRAKHTPAGAGAASEEAIVVVHVVLREDVVPVGVVSTPADFTGPTSAAARPALLYPEDGVVIPANLAPLVFQWDKVAPRGRVRLEGARGALTLYTDGVEAVADVVAWRRFLLAHVGGSFTVSIDESNGPGTEVFTTTITINLADADLTSTVYYWAVNLGRVVRIDADSLAPIDLAIPYEENGTTPAGTETQCRACHALSANGQRMSFTYFGGSGPGGVVDTSNVAAPVLNNQDERRWNFSALSPDGSLLLTNLNHRLALRDGVNGGALDGDASDGQDAAHPAWSPVGDTVAFAAITQRYVDAGGFSWEIDFTASDIHVATVDPLNRVLGTSRRLVPGNGRALYYPSFSPDGTLLTYTEGAHSRSSFNGIQAGDLWLADATDTSGDAPRVRLDRANPGHNSYLPTFNPKVEGGYMWVAFFSRRDYGHHIRGEQRPQIWVAAVDQDADPASALDGSHPGFWLPGQQEDTDNLSSFFAPKPCSDAGGACGSDDGCCGDLLCRPTDDSGGSNQCVPADQACTLSGDACADDCCSAADTCVDDGTGTRRCLSGSCANLNESCSDSRACCDGQGFCADGLCISIGG